MLHSQSRLHSSGCWGRSAVAAIPRAVAPPAPLRGIPLYAVRIADEVSQTPTTCEADPYTQLAALCEARGATHVGTTQRGRGLVLSKEMPEREALLTVPLYNSLIIADEPTSGISIFSDRQHRRWQDLHRELPPLLLEFLQGDARWDARMAAWLLWMVQHPSPLWRSYLALLPGEADMTCLLNFSNAEIDELQVPSLKAEAAVQANWCAHLHAKYFSSVSGTLSPLGLSSSLAHSLWAISLVRSRTFSEDVNGEALTLMVPYCDLANHCTDHNSTFCMSKDLKSFTLRSLRPLGVGEELTISYGAEKPNCEALRDYGFVLTGNRHDRIRFGSTTAAATSTADPASTQAAAGLHGLNEACLLEAAGFTGELSTGSIQPGQQLSTDLQQQQQHVLARREAALLSMPLKTTSSGGDSGGDSGGIFAWLNAAAQPWTESGRPPPQPLRPDQAAAERAAVLALQQELQQQLSDLPTSIQTDQELLAQLEINTGGRVAKAEAAQRQPPSSSTADVQQRRTLRLKQQQQQQATASTVPLAAGPNDRPPRKSRIMTAVRARLEHKLLLQEGLTVLQQYERYLADKFGA